MEVQGGNLFRTVSLEALSHRRKQDAATLDLKPGIGLLQFRQFFEKVSSGSQADSTAQIMPLCHGILALHDM
ncbi:hypothetical protein, partial [Herbiconiux flava]|uniref:hypothetical protein n=1 Tax=Herbiconiux flava TaxID=881268 RepID=UPI0022F310BB